MIAIVARTGENVGLGIVTKLNSYDVMGYSSHPSEIYQIGPKNGWLCC